MMGGGYFDNVWEPYTGAYAYPRTQPRTQFYRPRASVYDQRGASRVPENRAFPSKAEEASIRKPVVRTIPVTDGNAPVPVSPKVEVSRKVERAEVSPMVVKFESKDAAAMKIQAVYRGYSVRKTQPLKHLRVIVKVKEELENFKRKLQGDAQRKKLCVDPQERLRWTEGIMALLLRLDQLQGVHPEVRLVRKALTKELIGFQEKVDSMSDVFEEENGKDRAIDEENIDVLDASEEEINVVDGGANLPADEAMENIEVEECTPEGLSGVENVDLVQTIPNADCTNISPDFQQAMEDDSSPAGASNDCENDSDGIKVTENSTSEQQEPQVYSNICTEEVVASISVNCHDEGGSLAGATDESLDKEGECVLEPRLAQAFAEAPMDVENETQMSLMVPTRDLEEIQEAEVDFSQNVPPMDIESDNQDSIATASSIDFIEEPVAKEDALMAPAKDSDVAENHEQRDDMQREEEAERLTNEVEGPVLDTPPNNVNEDNPDASTIFLDGRDTDAGSTQPSDGWMIPASPSPAMSLEPQCVKNLQVDQPQPSTADDSNALSDRALLLQLLEENRKLKDVVGKVLHWGKQQNDIIHNLASRIEQLEEHQPQGNMLNGENNTSRKRISNDACFVGDRERSLRRIEKGRRKGKSGKRSKLGYLDSGDWLSAESDEYF